MDNRSTTLYWGPKFIYERYQLPIVITENGFAGLDWVDLDGAVHDPQRIDFTRRYLMELARAIEDEVTCAAISIGRYWTTSNGPTDTANASA